MCERVIGITGGIGAGKSVVSRVLALRGVPLYDCDFEARCLQETSPRIKEEIAAVAGSEVINPAGVIDRPRLAACIFSNESVRCQVNRIVHTAVGNHLRKWLSQQLSASPVVAVESAILASSGLAEIMSEIWLVTAPEELRVERVRMRNNLTREQIVERMEAQQREYLSLPARKLRVINNDGITPLLPQIDRLLLN